MSRLFRDENGDRIQGFDYSSLEDFAQLAAHDIGAIGECCKHHRGQMHTHKECDARVWNKVRCKRRFCPDCARIWSARARSVLLEVARDWRFPSMITLTCRNLPAGDLLRMRTRLDLAFALLRKRSVWKTGHRSKRDLWAYEGVDKRDPDVVKADMELHHGVKAAIKSSGLTFNSKSKTWHYHLHVAVDCLWMDRVALEHQWIDCLERCDLEGENATNITRAYGEPVDLIDEVLKGTKDDFSRMQKVFSRDGGLYRRGEILESLKGSPQYRPLGSANGRMRYVKEDLRRRALASCFCPRCSRLFDRAEWEPLGMLEILDYMKERHGTRWADVYEGWANEEVLSFHDVMESVAQRMPRVTYEQLTMGLGP